MLGGQHQGMAVEQQRIEDMLEALGVKLVLRSRPNQDDNPANIVASRKRSAGDYDLSGAPVCHSRGVLGRASKADRCRIY